MRKQKSNQKETTVQEDIVHEMLLKVAEKKIRTFKIYLDKENDLFLHIKYYNQKIRLRFEQIHKLMRNGTINEYIIMRLKSKGFVYANHDNDLVYTLSFANLSDIDIVKQTLSVIPFEALPFYCYRGRSYISY